MNNCPAGRPACNACPHPTLCQSQTAPLAHNSTEAIMLRMRDRVEHAAFKRVDELFELNFH